METDLKVRFAPSPTGPFHIGGARSALFNWLLARHTGGKFLVRIEDTDLARSSRESEENIKESLRWLGLDWDEGIDVGGENGPYRQTERLPLYKKEVERLIAEGKAYYCYCTQEELEEERKSQLAEGKTPVYGGRCQHLSEEERQKYEAEGRKPVVRLRVPTDEVYAFDDMVRGHVEFQSSGVGDFIIMKSDGIPVYNFAVVIDDALMKCTHVIRAEEHLSNTPRQIAIYRALGYPIPKFGHISLILGADHKKMSKRHGATSVTAYKEMGYLPDAMVNYLALLGWAPKGEEEIFSRGELIREFSMDRVSSNDAVFDIQKLNHINFQYMKKLSAEELTDFLLPFLEKAGYVTGPLSVEKRAWLLKVTEFLRDRISYGAEAPEQMKMFFTDVPPFTDEEVVSIMKKETSATILARYIEAIESAADFTEEALTESFKALMKETGIKGRDAFEPVRVALTGVTKGPGMYTMMILFGKEETLSRLHKGLNFAKA